MSENDGSTWTQMFKDTPIVRMLQNPHFEEMVRENIGSFAFLILPAAKLFF